MKLRPRHAFLLLAAVLLPAGAAWADSDGNLLANGDFTKVDGGLPAGWEVDADATTVTCEQVGGRWYHNAFTFNSGKYERIRVGFYMAPGANGSVWIDNLESTPKLAIVNSSFEEVDRNGGLVGWTMTDPGTLHSDTERVSHGRRSFRITYKAAEPEHSRIKQFVEVEPNTDYRITFDVYLGDDFLGALRPNIYAGVPDTPHITGPEWNADDIVSERGRFGHRLAMDLKGGQARIVQKVAVDPDRNLEASAVVETKGLEGSVVLRVTDEATEEILGQTKVEKADANWERVRCRFQSGSEGVVVSLVGKGEGKARIANARLGAPELIPPPQEIEWLEASENFQAGSELTVSVTGAAGRVIEKGLSMLDGEMGGVRRLDPGLGDVDIVVGDSFAFKDAGDEAYTLVVDSAAVRIESATEKGAFHGLMTVLQLVTDVAGAGKELLSCRIADWPDMPVRGVALTGGSITGDTMKDLDVMARMKFNTAIISLGTYSYETDDRSRARLQQYLDAGTDYGIEIIPLQTTLGWGHYVLNRNPNLAEGRWIRDEKLTLAGDRPVELAHRNVIRTELTDIVITSTDGKRTFKEGVDYRVIPGETKFEKNRFSADAEPWSIARIAGGAIGDGATVLAGYDCIGRAGKTRYAYCPMEPEVRELMGDWIEKLARDWPFPGNFICLDELHDRFYIDSRCIQSGKTSSEILSEHLRFLDDRARKGNPDIRLWMWGDMVDPHDAAASIGAKDIGPMLPKDIVQVVWGYSANVPKARGLAGVEYFSNLGISTLVCGWYDTNNIHQWMQVVRQARDRGLPCLGYLACVWHQRTEGVEESAICSWRIPREGEDRYAPID